MVFASGPLLAQQELGLHFLRNTWQSSKTNPAFLTEQRFHFGLPNLYFNVAHTGPSYNEVVVKNNSGEDVLDISAVIDLLEDDNQLFTNVELETFSTSFGFKNLRLSLSHAVKFNAFMDYPKNLVEVAWNGNAQFVGETVSVGPNFQAFAYNEFAIGGAMKFLNVTGGLRLKFLTGIGDASSSRTDLNIYTDPDVYQLTINSDYQINTSSFFAYDENGDFELDFGRFNTDRLFTNNFGMALDLGATIDLGKIEVAASVIDLGAIKWNSNITNYSSEGSYTYEGLDISGIVNDDSISFEETLDTLSEVFGFDETAESYSTMLPTKFYLSGTFKVNDAFEVGGLFYSEAYLGKVYPAFALSANASLGRIISLGAIYSIRNQEYFNIGLNTVIRLGPVQLFAATDNIFAAFQPYDSRNVNARLGLNIVFNKKS
jgi:hypothetical protein